MRQFYFFLFSLLFFDLNAQTIKGKLSDTQSPIAFANVVLYNSKDSSLTKFTYSDDNGVFIFDQLKPGTFYMEATFVGLENYRSKIIDINNDMIDLGNIIMQAHANQMVEVTITAQKPLMEVKPDKVVLNVAGSILATGDDALSLLRKAPGVMVDNNEKISLLGKSGLAIYIDGKPSKLTSVELANMLKNMSSNDIESIEIISNPSAKYEAQGTGGIINIKRKKLNNSGINGAVAMTARQGKTSGFNTSTSLNFKDEKVNIAGNVGYFNNNNLNYNNFIRRQNNLGFYTYNENNDSDNGFNTKVSGDYYLNKKSTLAIIAEYNTGDNHMTNNSVTKMGNIQLTSIDSLLVNQGKATSTTKNTNLNTNYYYDGGNETTLNIDVNFGRFHRDNDTYTPNEYRTPDNMTVTSTYKIRNITPTTIDISTIKADFEHKLGKGKISGGLKSALVRTDNNLYFYNIRENSEILNPNLSNRFKYDEWVNAGYLNYLLQLHKISLNAGIRAENSYTKGDLITINPNNNKQVKRSYMDFFPSAGLSFTPSQKHSFQFSYSRRINRPNYQDLNPFEFQLDELTYEKGNAFLNPEYTDNFQLSHTYAYKITSTLSYSHTSDVITRLVDISGLKGSYITWDNIAYKKVYAAGVSAPLSITDKWTTYTSLNAVHTRNRADFGDGKVIKLNVSSFNVYHQHTYIFSSGWSAEISGWYTSPSIWEGSFVMDAMGFASAGVSKKFMHNKAKLTLSIKDAFKTNVWKGHSTYGGLDMEVKGGWDSRRALLTLNYNFGKENKGKSTRNRSTGLEDEQNRIKKQ